MRQLPPMSTAQFIKNKKINSTDGEIDYDSLYSESIEKIKEVAIAPFFWFIPSNFEMRIKRVSENIGQFTPFAKDHWEDADPAFLADLYHPQDRFYVFSASTFAYNFYLSADAAVRDGFKFNIYGRMLNSKKEYRWTLMQISKFRINSHNEVESGLYIIYDLSHFKISSMPLLSIMNFSHKKVQYFKHFENQFNKIEVQIPHITARETEILKLMVQGFNTPEISKKLFISYYTVENHKRNMRKKTNTKTSSQLIVFVLRHNLLIN